MARWNILAAFVGGGLIGVIVTGLFLPGTIVEAWLFKWQTLMAGLVAFAGAIWTVTTIRWQVAKSREIADEQLLQTRRQFAHQMRVLTARDRAEIDRTARIPIDKLKELRRRIATATADRRQRSLTDIELVQIRHALKHAGVDLKQGRMALLRALLDAQGTRAVLQFMHRSGTVHTSIRGASHRAILDNTEMLQLIDNDARGALEAIEAARDEARDWVPPT